MEARFAMPRWPTPCCVCHAWNRDRICSDCRQRFAPRVPRCERCALRVPQGVAVCAGCVQAPPPFDRSIVAADYAFPWDGVIARFKFRDGLDIADALAALVADAVEAAGEAGRPVLVLPVPLGPARLAERGYNQSAQVAARAARRLDVPCHTTLLRRLVDTPHQSALPLKARQAAVRGCFGVDPAQSHPIRGHTVALLDDVMTTGATVAEAARTLKAAGAAAVHVWAIARTPPPSDA
jgi:ComF family protein